jgi:hypothetical protein
LWNGQKTATPTATSEKGRTDPSARMMGSAGITNSDDLVGALRSRRPAESLTGGFSDCAISSLRSSALSSPPSSQVCAVRQP